MSIGCFDDDIYIYGILPFNLELMKISTFFKKRGEIVSLAPAFAPYRYTTFYYRKDFYDGKVRKNLMDYKNINWGGHAFSGNTYIPMDEKIEKQIPDMYLYNNYRDKFNNTKAGERLFKILTDATHFRLSLDGKTIWKDFEKQIDKGNKMSIILHDYNLNQIQGSFEIIDSMSKEKLLIGKRVGIGNKFPIQVNNSKDFLKWSSLQPSANLFNLQYNGVIDDRALYDFAELTKNTSIARQLIYNITSDSLNEDDFVKNKILKIYFQVCFLCMNRLKISLKYEDNFFVHKEWEKIIDLFNCYISSFTSVNLKTFQYFIEKNQTMVDLVKHFKEVAKPAIGLIFSKQDVKELFYFVYEKNPELFNAFYNCSKVKLYNGRFVSE